MGFDNITTKCLGQWVHLEAHLLPSLALRHCIHHVHTRPIIPNHIMATTNSLRARDPTLEMGRKVA